MNNRLIVNNPDDGYQNTTEIYKVLKDAEKDGLGKITYEAMAAHVNFRSDAKKYGEFCRALRDLSWEMYYAQKQEPGVLYAQYYKQYDGWANDNFKGKKLEKYYEAFADEW